MATKKYQITQLQNDDSLLVLHPETEADIVVVDNSSGNYGGTATNVQDALEEVYTLAQTGGVTGVKGDAESSYRQGDVNITKANIGLGNVTNDKQVKGLSSGTTNGNLVKFGADGYTVADAGVSINTSTPSSSSTDAQVPTSKAVYQAIAAIPTPMQFKGTLGTNGTITTLPQASDSNTGYVYKVITEGTYNIEEWQGNENTVTSTALKVGDILVSTEQYYNANRIDYKWVIIPSGDDVEDTWREIQVEGTSKLGNGISTGAVDFRATENLRVGFNSSGNQLYYGVKSGYSIPSDTQISGWNAKYDKPSTGIPKTDLASAVQTSLGKADTALQSNQTITLSGDVSGSGKTSISVTLANSGVTAGTYSAVQVNSKGLVTSGGAILEVGAANQTTPSSTLAVGGLFFKQV